MSSAGFKGWVNRMIEMTGNDEMAERFSEEIRKSLKIVMPIVEELDKRRRGVS